MANETGNYPIPADQFAKKAFEQDLLQSETDANRTFPEIPHDFIPGFRERNLKQTFDQADQEKTVLFRDFSWSPSSEGGVLQLLRMENIEKPDDSIFLVVAEAPNAQKNSMEFTWFTQILEKQDIGKLVFPNLSHIKTQDKFPSPTYTFYTIKNGKFQECAVPQELQGKTPPPQELAA